MKQIRVNGQLVNAIEVYKKYISIPFEEAERLLTTNHDLDFIIYIPIDQQVLSLSNLETFRHRQYSKFLIRLPNTEGISDSADIEFALHEVGWDCIKSIKAHLERLGWFKEYDDGAECRIKLSTLEDLSVYDIYLDGDDIVLSYCRHGFSKKDTLSSMLIADEVSVNYIFDILKAIENVSALTIAMV